MEDISQQIINSFQAIQEQERCDAKVDLSQTEAALILLKNNTLACEIHISGLKIGICSNQKAIPALEYHKAEIEKFLNGDKTEYY